MSHNIGDIVMGSWVVIKTPPVPGSTDLNRYLVQDQATGQTMDWIDNPLDAGYIPPPAPGASTSGISLSPIVFAGTTQADGGITPTADTAATSPLLLKATKGSSIHVAGYWRQQVITTPFPSIIIGTDMTHGYLIEQESTGVKCYYNAGSGWTAFGGDQATGTITNDLLWKKISITCLVDQNHANWFFYRIEGGNNWAYGSFTDSNVDLTANYLRFGAHSTANTENYQWGAAVDSLGWLI